MLTGPRTFLIGMHNPIYHSLFVILAWKKLYNQYPTIKEFICIVLHDVGYIVQRCFDCETDNHPVYGARICDWLLGMEYYQLCIRHSRAWAVKNGFELSKLCYADKYSILLTPNWLFKFMIYLGGEAQQYHRTTKTYKWGYPIDVNKIKADYQTWFNKYYYEA